MNFDRYLIIILFTWFLCSLGWILLHSTKKAEQYDHGFNAGVAMVQGSVEQMQDKYDSVVKITHQSIQVQIQTQIKIKHHYDTIYSNINSITADSAIQLRAIERGQFRNYYGY